MLRVCLTDSHSRSEQTDRQMDTPRAGYFGCITEIVKGREMYQIFMFSIYAFNRLVPWFGCGQFFRSLFPFLFGWNLFVTELYRSQFGYSNFLIDIMHTCSSIARAVCTD